jgi:hypothetical protein
MGLMIHSLGELPTDPARGYYVYLLDYGWHEPLGEALHGNFDRMADLASRHNAVVIRGVVGAHFTDEVLSWHQINGQPGEEILPAILITTRNPHEFRENSRRDEGRTTKQHPMLLIPLRKACSTTTDVAMLIEKVFRDIQEKKNLSDFEIAKKLSRGQRGALVDALILQPNISGVGIDFNRIISFFRGGRS